MSDFDFYLPISSPAESPTLSVGQNRITQPLLTTRQVGYSLFSGRPAKQQESGNTLLCGQPTVSGLLVDGMVVLGERRIRWGNDTMLKKEPSLFLPEVASVGSSLSKNPSLDRSMVYCLETYSGRQDLALELASGAVLVDEFPILCFSFLICTVKGFLPTPSCQEKPGQKGSAGRLPCVEAVRCPSQVQQSLPLATDVGICQTNPNHLMRNENGAWFLHLIAPLKTTHGRFIVITIIAS